MSDSDANSYNYDHIKGVFDKDITDKERVDRYSKVATDYEQDVIETGYKAHTVTACALGKFVSEEDRPKYKILDIAAGTGLVAEELKKLGFTVMDALEPAQGMLDQAEKKHLYRNMKCNGLSKEPLPYETDSYDAITICGWHGSVEPLCDSLPEMIRVVKPGGYICIVTRMHYIQNLPAYKDKFIPLLSELERGGEWTKAEEITGSICYPFNNEGAEIVYRVCKKH